MSFNWNPEENNDETFTDRTVDLDENGEWADVNSPEPIITTPAPFQNIGKQMKAPVPQQPVEQSVIEEQEAEEQVEEDYTSVLSDARLRLEQGRLYEMLMNNNLFQDLDVDPKAVKNVEREVKNFAKERMEIMLGMRQEKSKESLVQVVASPFNDLEMEALRALASAATKGATKAPEAQVFSAGPAAPPKRGSLTPIGGKGASQTRPVQAPKPQARKLPAAPNSAIQRRRNEDIEQILAEEGVTREELEATFPADYKPIEKPLAALTEQEKIDRAKQTAERIKTKVAVKSTKAAPMPTQDQINQMNTMKGQAAEANPNMMALMTLLNSKK